MRYRIGEEPGLDPYGSTDEFVVFTAVLSLFIGTALVWMGQHGRQRWLTVWSAGLIVASVAYLGWTFLAT